VISHEGASGNVALCLADGASAPVSALAQGRFRYNSALSRLEYSENGGPWTPLTSGGSGGGWTDDGLVVRLTTATDTVSVGNNLMAGTEKLRVTGGALLADGTVGATPVSGAGVRLMWTPSKYALRAGEVTATQWDAVNIGDWSAGFGLDVIASGAASFAANRDTLASGDISAAFGNGSQSEAVHSTAFGSWSKARRPGQVAMATGYFAAPGDFQQSLITMRRRSTSAFPTDLTIDGGAPAGVALPTSNRFILEDNFTYTFEVLVQARNEAASESKSWAFFCQMKRDVGAGTTALVGPVSKSIIGQTPAAATWDANLVADAANGAFVVRVNGQAGKNIRFGAGIRWIEVGT